VREEAAPGRGNGGDMPVALTEILIDKKIKKIHTVNLAATNGR
jgi:hypothetical protein